MKLRDIHLRDPFIFAENGVYYLYGTRRGPATKVIPWTGLDVYTSTVTRDHGFRRLGVIESAYLMDDMFVELICDGKHLPPELIRLIYKIKGADKIALVTDSLALAGTEQTHGFMQSTEFIIEDGVCKLMDRSAFAGSIAYGMDADFAVFDDRIQIKDVFAKGVRVT